MILFLLYETQAGYGLFELQEFDEANLSSAKVQKYIATFSSFSKIVNMIVLIQRLTNFRHSIHLEKQKMLFSI